MSLTARVEALEAVVHAQHAWIQGSQRVNLRALHLLEKLLTHAHPWECPRHRAHARRVDHRACADQQDFGFGYGNPRRAEITPLWFASGERLDDPLSDRRPYVKEFSVSA